MKYIHQFVAIIDTITELFGRIIAWLTLIMVAVSFLVVVLRYGFNLGWIGMQESVMYMHGFIFMLGAGYTLKWDGHVRVDIFYQRFSVRTKALVNLLGSLFFLAPLCVFIVIISYDYVLSSWAILEQSPEAGGLPFVYISKSFIFLLASTFLLQGIAEFFRNLLILISNQHNNSQSQLEVN